MRSINLFVIAISVFILLTSSIEFSSNNSSFVIPINKVDKEIKLGVYKDVRAIEFKQIIDKQKYILLDVRTKNEFNAGHIAGAINIDWYLHSFEALVQKLDKSKPILIYCRSGNRTSKTKFAMLGMGFQNVINLHYGVNDWAKSGYGFVK